MWAPSDLQEHLTSVRSDKHSLAALICFGCRISLLIPLTNASFSFPKMNRFDEACVCCRQAGASSEHAAAASKLWVSESKKVHEVVVKQSMWGDRVEKISWRIDVPTSSKVFASSPLSCFVPPIS